MDGLGFALFEDVGVGLGGGVDAGVKHLDRDISLY